MASLTLPGRFNGPPRTANGGYAAGRLAAFVDPGTVAVRLRRPPPLDVELTVRRDADAAELHDGDELIARAEPATLPEPGGDRSAAAASGDRSAAASAPAATGVAPGDRSAPAASGSVSAPPAPGVPAAPAVEEARAAQAGRGARGEHPFPTCFGCGPARPPGESVAALLGPLPGRPEWAGVWTPTDRLPHADGHVADEVAWVALDCPSAQPIAPDDGPPHVLGTFTVQLLAPVALDAEHILLAWPIGERDGRKQRAGSAVLRADGTLCARAEALWIALPPP